MLFETFTSANIKRRKSDDAEYVSYPCAYPYDSLRVNCALTLNADARGVYTVWLSDTLSVHGIDNIVVQDDLPFVIACTSEDDAYSQFTKLWNNPYCEDGLKVGEWNSSLFGVLLPENIERIAKDMFLPNGYIVRLMKLTDDRTAVRWYLHSTRQVLIPKVIHDAFEMYYEHGHEYGAYVVHTNVTMAMVTIAGALKNLCPAWGIETTTESEQEMEEEVIEVVCVESGAIGNGTIEDLESDNWYCIDGDWYSEGHWFECEHCNTIKPESRRNSLCRSEDICSRCVDRHYYQCSDCSELVHADDAISLNDGMYHPDCAPDYHWCDRADEYVTGYSDDCRFCNKERLLLNYSMKFNDLNGFSFHAANGVITRRAERRIGYYGLEIESAHRSGDWSDGAERFWEVFGHDYGQAVIKEDGSLHDRGYELVTQPRTLESYENWTRLWNYIDWMRDNGFEGWKPVDNWGERIRAGIHIHVSRTAFSNRAHVARFIKSVYMWREQMKKFSGRNSAQYADYCTYEESHFIDRAKGERNGNRMVAVNCQNDNTIELRIFRSSLRILTIKAYIEMTDALLEWSRQMDCAKHYRGEFSFSNFIAWMGDKPQYANALERINARVLLTPTES